MKFAWLETHPKLSGIKPGDKFGAITVIGPSERRSCFVIRCSCGREYETQGYNLLVGRVTHCQSCGYDNCKRTLRLREKFAPGTKHGNWTVLEYLRSNCIRVRCDCGNETARSMNCLGKSKACRKCYKRTTNHDLANERKEVVEASLKAGISQATIGRVVGLSRQRVCQLRDQMNGKIVHKYRKERKNG